MTKRESKSQLTWIDVKAQLATFDRTALLDLLHHLYAPRTRTIGPSFTPALA
jgi:hypothetical protein